MARRKQRFKNIDDAVVGKEPTWWDDLPEDQLVIEDETLRLCISKSFNWYNYKYNSKEAAKYLKKWMADYYEAEDIKSVSALPDWKVPKHLGWIARMLSLGCEDIPKDMLQRFKENINKIIKKGEKEKVEKAKLAKLQSKEKVFKIVEKDHLAFADELIDLHLTGELGKDFDLFTELAEKKYNKTQYREISEHIKEIRAEVNLASSKAAKHKDYVEIYSFLTKAKLKKYETFLTRLEVDCVSLSRVKKRVYRKRNTTLKNQKMFENLDYLKEHPPMAITGIPIENTINSKITSLYFYDVERRFLSIFKRKKTDEAFSYKGKSLINFNDDSFVITIRKPEQIVPRVMGCDKRSIDKVINGVRAKHRKVKGKLNKNMILIAMK